MDKVAIFACGALAAPIAAKAAKAVHNSAVGPLVEVATVYLGVMAVFVSASPNIPPMNWVEYCRFIS